MKSETRRNLPGLAPNNANFGCAKVTGHRAILGPPQIRLTYNQGIPMKAYVYVSLKKTVLDPQGKTIQGALKKMGYQGLGDVRQGKFFEIALNGGLTKEQAHAEVEKMAREVLTNPVIEEFRFSVEA
jgi:phosphoribosylformylglycinamidine synthase